VRAHATMSSESDAGPLPPGYHHLLDKGVRAVLPFLVSTRLASRMWSCSAT
jgi:hypothetical protein